MNHWHNEFMAEYHRHRIREEIEQIRLERIALRSRVYRPGFYARTMYSFANWMISAGKQLRKRYEIPALDCSKPRTESFAN
jgi:elongation factor P hydroxylase